MTWMRSLTLNAEKLEKLAAFYQEHGFVLLASLLAASALEIRQSALPKYQEHERRSQRYVC